MKNRKLTILKAAFVVYSFFAILYLQSLPSMTRAQAAEAHQQSTKQCAAAKAGEEGILTWARMCAPYGMKQAHAWLTGGMALLGLMMLRAAAQARRNED